MLCEPLQMLKFCDGPSIFSILMRICEWYFWWWLLHFAMLMKAIQCCIWLIVIQISPVIAQRNQKRIHLQSIIVGSLNNLYGHLRTNGVALRSAIWANWHTNTQWTLQKWLCKWFPNLLKRKLNRNNPNPPRELLYLQLWKTSHALCVHHQTCTKLVISKLEVIRAVWTKKN